jgi:hypothetical protein
MRNRMLLIWIDKKDQKRNQSRLDLLVKITVDYC